MEIKCPACAHAGTERLALTYSRGKSNTKTTSASVSVGLGRLFVLLNPMTWVDGLMNFSNPMSLLRGVLSGFGFVFGLLTIGRSRGTTQSVLSAEIAPPEKSRWVRMLLQGALLSFIVLLIVNSLGPQHVSGLSRFLVLSVAPLLTVVAVVHGIHFNRNIWPAREAHWQRSFMCRRCGTVFHVAEFNPPALATVSSFGKAGEFLPRINNPS